MWYPEEPITYCEQCQQDIPDDCFWRGRGSIISHGGSETRTLVLYSLCPGCANRLSVGLDGPWWYRHFYGWMWRIRYPRTKRPHFDSDTRRRA